MKIYDESVEINHNSNWSYFPSHPYMVSITDGSGSGKINKLLSLIKNIYNQILTTIYLYAKDPLKSKYQLLINGRRKSRD